MFSLKVDSDLELRLVHPNFAQKHFDTIISNQAHIGEWLEWASRYQSVQDSYNFISAVSAKYNSGEALETLIFSADNLVGGVGYTKLGNTNMSGEIGYWLAKDYTGKGIMTKSVRRLMQHGFEFLNLNKIIIRAAIGNEKSANIARKLGFTQEGILRSDIQLHGKYVDCYTFGFLKSEWSK